MPTYEYKCKSCGHVFEKMGRMSDPPEAECPECGGSARKRVTACAGVISKGNASQPSCGKDARCCGRDSPCEKPPCDGRY